ncbi:hypothetical protein V6N11_026110 [Hibiscus sabdariffa]|uniref:RING-type E3 ubiquitin transferase n=1 Tax=Hibiscus sabdariffa TaxID=183260 RepID=A0ABR2SUP8_9ROSI
MPVSPDAPEQTSNPLSHLLSSVSSYDANVLLAAIISLLLVILFVLLLHVYAQWFLAQARQRSRSSSLSHVFHPDRFRHFHSFTFDATFPSIPSKGLDSSVISSIPSFVYKVEEHRLGLDCVICLSPFEGNEVGRKLPKCGHGFHVECIDMWLHSHSNCPVCRAPVLLSNDADSQVSSLETVGEILNGENVNGSSEMAAAIDDNDNPSPSSSSLTVSLKRMLSRNRSERKVFPSSNPNLGNLLSSSSLIIQTSIGPFGSPISSSLLMSAEFNLLPHGNPTFMLHFKPRLGDFSIKKSQSPTVDKVVKPSNDGVLEDDTSTEVVDFPAVNEN